MTAKAGDILRRPPRRGARQWRYISPHRRGAGVALLLVLTLGVVAYWLVPRLVNSWTRDQAVAYLRNFTGGQVSIREARFNLFGGIELRGVEVAVPGSPAAKPFLQAETVVLRHRPWSLFSEGRLEATEIVCIAPIVTLEYDDQRHRYTAEDLIAAARRQRGWPAKPESQPTAAVRPVISIRDVRLRLLTGQALLNITMVPTEGGYRITLEEEQAAAKDSLYGSWRLDLGTGRLVLLESKIPRLGHTDALLPAQYAQFRKRYDIQGRVVLKGGSAAGSKAVLEAALDNVSLQLQPAEGGLGLTDVCGTLVFEENRVHVRDLTGQVLKAGDAIFRASGVYEGYDPNSGFDLHVTVEGMVLPDGSRATGWLADTLKLLRKSFRPSGKVDVQADVRRKARGPIELTGTARPVGMSFLYEEFPYAVDQVTGAVAFEAGPGGDRVLLRNVIARHGPAEMTVSGEVDLRKPDCFDIRVTGKNVPLDGQIRAAIPKEYQPFWDRFRPDGLAGANVHVWQKGRGQPQHTALQVILDGRAAMTYDGFPYRLDSLAGTIRIDGSEITVESLNGRNGAMRCTIDGSLSGLATTKGQTNLTIEANALPLDANLMAALPKQARDLVAGLHLTGQAERASAKLLQSAQDPLDFRVTANIKDVSLRPEAFPYAVTGVSGSVTVRPGRVDLAEIVGTHGKTKLTLRGQAVLDGKGIGLDLHAEGNGVALDKELLDALPEDARAIWRKLSPAGQADVSLAIQHNLPGAAKKLDYALSLQARGMAVRYADFPYALTDVAGRAVITPEGVSLDSITARHGEARLAFHGRLTQGPEGEDIHLAVDGTDVPIDRDLLAALPDSLAPLGKRFQPGGRCNLVLESLDIFRPASRGAAASRPATAPASGAATTAPAGTMPATIARDGAVARWAVRGAVAARDVMVDLGLGQETLTGGLRGEAVQKGSDLSVNALLDLDSVILGAKQLTQVRGQVTKKPGTDLLRILDLTAQAYGGQVAGFAEFRLADPLQFGVSLAVQDIHLEELFKGDPNAAAGHDKVKGLLAGNLQLTAAGGKNAIRQASGVLKISDAELYKLPVMLGLLNVLYLAVPGDTAFTQGQVTYRLRNDKMVFEEIWLQGPALSIVGTGNMDMNTEVLDLTFLTGPPKKLRGLAGLSDLLEDVQREVAQIQVDGTLSKPRMRTVPLRSLDRLIREMLNPGRTK